MTQRDAVPDIIIPTEASGELPEVRSISPADLVDALLKGVDDFRAMPTHALFVSVIYPIAGLAIGRAALGYDLVPLLYPLAAGFALIGPFAAIGLYELSRRRQLGRDTSLRHALDFVRSPSFPAIAMLGLLLMIIFAVWVSVAYGIYVAEFGYQPVSPGAFLHEVFTTPQGHDLIVIGNVVGFLFALLAFSLSVVAFPLLLDRNTGATAAAVTSVRAVLNNPGTMALWGLIVAGALVVGSLPFLIGLAVVMPVLGHATWHLYCKVVGPDVRPRPEYHPRPAAPPRYAADFPAVLFEWMRRSNRG
jgi:uncharacterized membrane protein